MQKSTLYYHLAKRFTVCIMQSQGPPCGVKTRNWCNSCQKIMKKQRSWSVHIYISGMEKHKKEHSRRGSIAILNYRSYLVHLVNCILDTNWHAFLHCWTNSPITVEFHLLMELFLFKQFDKQRRLKKIHPNDIVDKGLTVSKWLLVLKYVG